MRTIAAALAAILAVLPAAAEERIADVRQGTNLALDASPDGTTLVVDLLGQLWSVPRAGGAAVPLTPAGETARNPRFSSDGARVVYQRLLDGQWDVWLLDLASTERRALTSTRANEREPHFSADGRSVVFASDRTGHYCLWAVTVGDGIETQLTEEPGDAAYPAVAADGTVAYAHQRAAESWSLRVLRDGVVSTLYESARPIAAPSWRPGGGVLVFGEQDSGRSSRLWLLIASDPAVIKPLTGGEDVFATRVGWLSAAEFAYAADGQVWRRGIAHPFRYPVHVFAGAAVTVATPITPALPSFDEPGERKVAGISEASHSEDGRQSVFSALGDLWLAERGRAQRLTDDAHADRDPVLLPDGSAVIFSSDRNGQFELWRLSLDDRRLTALTSGAVLPRAPIVRADGRQIAYLEAESFEPWAAARLKVRDYPSGAEATVAAHLEGATRPQWAADGRSLVIPATSGETSPEAPRGLGVTLMRPLSTPAQDRVAEPLPTIAWRTPQPPADYVVEVGRLFDGVSGSYRRHVDLHVRAGRIAAVVPRGTLPSNGGTIIDARERTVIPGLIDVHVHQPALAGERLGRAWLAHGVTTIREIADRPAEALERAETWASGRALGPRLLISPASDTAHQNDAALPIRRFGAVVEGFAHSLPRQARELGVPAKLRSAVAPLPLRLAPSVPVGLELEVSPALATYQDGVSRLVTAGATFAPGLAAINGMSGWPSATPNGRRRAAAYRTLFNPAEQSAWERQNAWLDGTLGLGFTVARIARAGGIIAIGSEAPAVPFGVGVHLEMAALERAGMARDQVLRIATMGGAIALGVERQLGSLEEGKLADFVVLDGDPLADVGAALDIHAVVQGGKWHDRATLLAAP
jgi:dipeptidyl aminopeptidase/acylaminoacyl peptidase